MDRASRNIRLFRLLTTYPVAALGLLCTQAKLSQRLNDQGCMCWIVGLLIAAIFVQIAKVLLQDGHRNWLERGAGRMDWYRCSPIWVRLHLRLNPVLIDLLTVFLLAVATIIAAFVLCSADLTQQTTFTTMTIPTTMPTTAPAGP